MPEFSSIKSTSLGFQINIARLATTVFWEYTTEMEVGSKQWIPHSRQDPSIYSRTWGLLGFVLDNGDRKSQSKTWSETLVLKASNSMQRPTEPECWVQCQNQCSFTGVREGKKHFFPNHTEVGIRVLLLVPKIKQRGIYYIFIFSFICQSCVKFMGGIKLLYLEPAKELCLYIHGLPAVENNCFPLYSTDQIGTNSPPPHLFLR